MVPVIQQICTNLVYVVFDLVISTDYRRDHVRLGVPANLPDTRQYRSIQTRFS